ncbi:MAG: hypothetical protein ACI4VL_02740 [Bacilli bacterium]
MNDNTYNSNNGNDNVGPYKATGNLNTVISNPSANINNTMEVNIQNAKPNLQDSALDSGAINQSSAVDLIQNQNNNVQNINQSTLENINSIQYNDNFTDKSSTVAKTYVTSDNKPKKKTISLNIGPEFKIAILIIVILLLFIFLLPMLPNLF